MQILINTLAIIGGIFVFYIIMVILLVVIATFIKGRNKSKTMDGICLLTDDECHHEGTCRDCPVAEEAEKIGNR